MDVQFGMVTETPLSKFFPAKDQNSSKKNAHLTKLARSRGRRWIRCGARSHSRAVPDKMGKVMWLTQMNLWLKYV